MSIDVLTLVKHEVEAGYSEAEAQAKICQDLVLKAISDSPMNRNVTIKGGVVMRSKTNNIRRATLDLDIDFIRTSLSEASIDQFILCLNNIPGVKFERYGNIEELNQQDYQGKRIFIKIEDQKGNELKSKIDLGVHKELLIEQEEYCFNLSFSEDGASLLINSNEQMFVEKLCSLLRFGPSSTRYKDLFDMYFLLSQLDEEKLKSCLATKIFDNEGMREQRIDDILIRLNSTFKNKIYIKSE